jgi:hypothetical protein
MVHDDMRLSQGRSHRTNHLEERFSIPDKKLEEIRRLGHFTGRGEKVWLGSG